MKEFLNEMDLNFLFIILQRNIISQLKFALKAQDSVIA